MIRDTIDRLVNVHSSNNDSDGKPTAERMLRACLEAILAPASVATIPLIELQTARALRDSYEALRLGVRNFNKAQASGSSVLMRDAEEEMDSIHEVRVAREEAFMKLCGHRMVEVHA